MGDNGLHEIATLTLAMTGLGGSGFEIATLSLVGDIMDYNDLQEIATLTARW